MTHDDRTSPAASRDDDAAPRDLWSEDPELAALMAAAEREADIPFAAFAAVAELLSYLYRLDSEGGARGAPV